ncbi:hypothetical protein JCGZ_15289 [Jatropha curcas]|uniref:Uncharacterized protein n=1 Tax=Jatropha curcas TaxID=180498 RepID=A0A067LM34_JATCU|nr:hypothetical protein JCGZ_15289 [Jatropha curcas]
MIGSFVTRIATYLRVWNSTRPIYDSIGGGRGTRLDIDLMIHMKIVEKVRDSYRLVGTRADSSDHEAPQDTGGANTEEDIPPPFPGFGVSSGAGTSGAGPSFQGTSTVSNDESMEIMHGSLDSRLDTLQGQYQGLSAQLQTVIQLL